MVTYYNMRCELLVAAKMRRPKAPILWKVYQASASKIILSLRQRKTTNRKFPAQPSRRKVFSSNLEAMKSCGNLWTWWLNQRWSMQTCAHIFSTWKASQTKLISTKKSCITSSNGRWKVKSFTSAKAWRKRTKVWALLTTFLTNLTRTSLLVSRKLAWNWRYLEKYHLEFPLFEARFVLTLILRIQMKIKVRKTQPPLSVLSVCLHVLSLKLLTRSRVFEQLCNRWLP